MNAKVLWGVLAIVILGLIVWLAVAAPSASAPSQLEMQEEVSDTSEQTPTDEEPVGDNPYAAVVSYTDNGFEPATVTIATGETVRFVNQSSSRGMWVGADAHPTHTEYDGTSTREHCVDGAATGGSFDMCRAAGAGEFWEFTFPRAGTFEYHNHAAAAHGGTIIVN